MFRSTRPASSTEHVLHRQPRQSPLGGTRRHPEEDAGTNPEKQEKKFLRRWHDRRTMPPPKRIDLAVTVAPASNEQAFNPPRYPAVTHPDHGTNPRRWSRNTRTRDAMAVLVGDVPNPVAPDRLLVARHPSYARHSSEWETETLLDQSNADPDPDVVLYPCPFRIRNPARFNIRDHESCARATFDSVRLKHHILTHHRRKPILHQCKRCKQQFNSDTALETHLLLPRDEMCEVNPSSPDDPDDGIPDETHRALKSLDTSDPSTTWETIYHLLFPSDLDVPSPDPHPLIELPELEAALDANQPTLKTSLREKLALLLPPALLDADDTHYLSFLTGQLALVVETHQVDVIRQCQARHAPGTDGRKKNRRSRRSTLLLQSFQKNSGEQGRGVQRHSRRGSKRVSLLLDEQQAGRASHARSPAIQDESDDSLPDPRDSGISMSCDTCGGEACCCGRLAGQDGRGETGRGATASPDARHQDDPGERHENREGGEGVGREQMLPRQSRDGYTPPVVGRELPRLSLRTSGLTVGWHGVGEGEVGSAVGGGSGSGRSGVAGRFSPESFKQRVLRAGMGSV